MVEDFWIGTYISRAFCIIRRHENGGRPYRLRPADGAAGEVCAEMLDSNV